MSHAPGDNTADVGTAQAYSVSVRNLCEFAAKLGDLD
jgi:hypothetical protein